MEYCNRNDSHSHSFYQGLWILPLLNIGSVLHGDLFEY